jgi:hypothetical protein
MTLSCIACQKHLTSAWKGELEVKNQPWHGTAFLTHGHYGSTVFDPMDGSSLEISVCDDCLQTAAKRRQVLYHHNGDSRLWQEPIDA